MPKPPVDDLMEAILKAAKAAGMNVGSSEIKQALGAVTKVVKSHLNRLQRLLLRLNRHLSPRSLVVVLRR
jgi:hypothetical protein